MIDRWSQEKPKKGKNGDRWNFTYWHSFHFRDHGKNSQRLFFWNDDKSECGVVILLPGRTVSYSRIKSLIAKIVADQTLRKKYYREIQFPLEKHYPEYGAFPEEF
jgi:hypothetical protein